MKKLLFIVALLAFCLATSFSQMAVRTEGDFNLSKTYLAASTDTIVTAAAMTAGTNAYLVAIVINKPVTSDTITVKDGATETLRISFTSSPPVLPVWVPYGFKLTTSFIYKQTSTSNVTLIYRTRKLGG